MTVNFQDLWAFWNSQCENMATKKLRRAGLSQELCDRLSRHQIITCRDFLCLSLLELMKVTGKSYWNVQKLLCKVSLACAPKMQTAYEMKMKTAINPSSAFLSTTLNGLDKALHGGVACGSLTEVTGPSGCGKTQFCLMMSVLATLPISMGGLDGAVIYIDTESAFGAERLVEIAEHRFPNYFGTEEKLFSMTRSIHLYRELTCDSVLKRIKTLEEEIISKKVKLVVIDSVASVVRKEFDTKLQGNLMERSNFLAREASLLKYLAEEFSIPTDLQPMHTLDFLFHCIKIHLVSIIAGLQHRLILSVLHEINLILYFPIVSSLTFLYTCCDCIALTFSDLS
uniref:DNA repair protein RAD51 homolog 2 n=1 Tax=Gopherus evgoodei TaxID=1825980 RepID=A0A8C4YEM5_9SAUR